jgi:hypothetical protein
VKKCPYAYASLVFWATYQLIRSLARVRAVLYTTTNTSWCIITGTQRHFMNINATYVAGMLNKQKSHWSIWPGNACCFPTVKCAWYCKCNTSKIYPTRIICFISNLKFDTPLCFPNYQNIIERANRVGIKSLRTHWKSRQIIHTNIPPIHARSVLNLPSTNPTCTYY